MGGTFNPVHHGHLVTAEEALTSFKLEKIIFVPSHRPPHKSMAEIASDRDRLYMLELATCSNLRFEVSDFEIERHGISYTLETLKHFKQLYGIRSCLYFITGADSILEIDQWHQIEKFWNYCEMVAATRPEDQLTFEKQTSRKSQSSSSREALLREKLDQLSNRFKLKIYVLKIPLLQISSTDIRRRLKRRLPIKYLLPEGVEAYVYKRGLYR